MAKLRDLLKKPDNSFRVRVGMVKNRHAVSRYVPFKTLKDAIAAAPGERKDKTASIIDVEELASPRFWKLRKRWVKTHGTKNKWVQTANF